MVCVYVCMYFNETHASDKVNEYIMKTAYTINILSRILFYTIKL